MITQALTGILLATLSLSAATVTCAAQCPLIPDGNATLEESERVALLSEFKFEALDKGSRPWTRNWPGGTRRIFPPQAGTS